MAVFHGEPQVVEILRKFRNSDPRMYEALLRLMDSWTWNVTVAVTETSSADILQAQGRAVQQRKLMECFLQASQDPPSATP